MVKFLFLLVFIFSNALLAKTIEIEVLAKKSEVTKEMTDHDLLTLNGLRQAVTGELEALKLDSKLYWEKLDQKKMTASDELQFLKPLFSNIVVAEFASADKEEAKTEVNKEDVKLSGSMRAELDIEKLKNNFLEVTTNIAETKQKTFYILGNIDIDPGMAWEDVGVTRAENFTGVIIDSWKKLALKEFQNFERVEVLVKDFVTRPEYMNSKSVTLKWNSTVKKTLANPDKKTAIYELSAQYVLVNTKSGTVISAFDFPAQKRELDTQNKKVLSSTLASLIYNLLLSQTSKLTGVLESHGGQELSHFDIKIATKAGLSEIHAINNLLQEKFKDIKLTSTMKSYSQEGSTLSLEALGPVDQILDRLSLEGGKYPLNEQKILLFNRADKSFAIISKDSNN